MSTHDDKAELLARSLNPEKGSTAATEKAEQRWADFQALVARTQADPQARAELAEEVAAIDAILVSHPDDVAGAAVVDLSTSGGLIIQARHYPADGTVRPAEEGPRQGHTAEQSADQIPDSTPDPEIPGRQETGPSPVHFHSVHGNVTIGYIGRRGADQADQVDDDADSRSPDARNLRPEPAALGWRRAFRPRGITPWWVGATMLAMAVGAIVLAVSANTRFATTLEALFAFVPAMAVLLTVASTATLLKRAAHERDGEAARAMLRILYSTPEESAIAASEEVAKRAIRAAPPKLDLTLDHGYLSIRQGFPTGTEESKRIESFGDRHTLSLQPDLM